LEPKRGDPARSPGSLWSRFACLVTGYGTPHGRLVSSHLVASDLKDSLVRCPTSNFPRQSRITKTMHCPMMRAILMITYPRRWTACNTFVPRGAILEFDQFILLGIDVVAPHWVGCAPHFTKCCNRMTRLFAKTSATSPRETTATTSLPTPWRSRQGLGDGAWDMTEECRVPALHMHVGISLASSRATQ
jgi:hypothetical protein